MPALTVNFLVPASVATAIAMALAYAFWTWDKFTLVEAATGWLAGLWLAIVLAAAAIVSILALAEWAIRARIRRRHPVLQTEG
ncbi:MAG: hypothetical protein HXX15_09935 [Rhodopseudomonas sp.]|uniref:hypothetical protein n=1 Tax=Rhodopseudomonas sp. TaxID=1078 RepID=UPI0017DD8DA7|nr:hypothetical protein [Rhodopseudomonas sp.]NVN86393.1 hypothetical protein [Rhodopseudomonas sp.]